MTTGPETSNAVAAGPAPATAAPYTTPAEPPQEAGDLEVIASEDAYDRLAAVAEGILVDSGPYHLAGYNPGFPLRVNAGSVSLSTPSGNIHCTGTPRWVICKVEDGTVPAPPRPTTGAVGNWAPYIGIDTGGVSYGTFAGNPLVNAESTPLPYGSTLRFGDTGCRSAPDGLTCVNYVNSTGFHLSRDDFTPLKALRPVPRDTRIEPRGAQAGLCGPTVNPSSVDKAIAELPTPAGVSEAWESGSVDWYSCGPVTTAGAAISADEENTGGFALTHVLLFRDGRFIGTLTSVPYYGLRVVSDSDDADVLTAQFLLYPQSSGGEAEVGTLQYRWNGDEFAPQGPLPDGARGPAS